MTEETEEIHVRSDEEQYAGPWQVAGRKKGKGRSEPPTATQPEHTSSATAQPSLVSASFGPSLAQAVAKGADRRGRDRSPRRPSATGTPARGSESGTMRQSAGAEEVPREPPKHAEDAVAEPSMPPRSPAAPSCTAQHLAEAREAPYMPTMGANTADDETPCLDSLPSTPRAGSAERAIETPCGTAQMEDDRPPAEQGTAAEAVLPEHAAAEAAAAAEPPPGAPATPLQNAFMAEANAGAVHPTGSGATN